MIGRLGDQRSSEVKDIGQLDEMVVLGGRMVKADVFSVGCQ